MCFSHNGRGHSWVHRKPVHRVTLCTRSYFMKPLEWSPPTRVTASAHHSAILVREWGWRGDGVSLWRYILSLVSGSAKIKGSCSAQRRPEKPTTHLSEAMFTVKDLRKHCITETTLSELHRNGDGTAWVVDCRAARLELTFFDKETPELLDFRARSAPKRPLWRYFVWMCHKLPTNRKQKQKSSRTTDSGREQPARTTQRVQLFQLLSAASWVWFLNHDSLRASRPLETQRSENDSTTKVLPITTCESRHVIAPWVHGNKRSHHDVSFVDDQLHLLIHGERMFFFEAEILKNLQRPCQNIQMWTVAGWCTQGSTEQWGKCVRSNTLSPWQWLSICRFLKTFIFYS